MSFLKIIPTHTVPDKYCATANYFAESLSVVVSKPRARETTPWPYSHPQTELHDV